MFRVPSVAFQDFSMRYLLWAAMLLLTTWSGISPGAEPSAPESRGDKESQLARKLDQLTRLQQEIAELRREVGPTRIRLEVQVIEVNHTKLRNLGFDWKALSSPKQDAAAEKVDLGAFLNAMAHNNLAKVIAEPSALAINGTKSTILADDGKRLAVACDCTPTLLENGKIRLAMRNEVSRIGEASFRVRALETTIEVEPGSSNVIAGDSEKRILANGDVHEIGLFIGVKAIIARP